MSWWSAIRATMQALADLTDTGFRRYIAQQRRGESPWNPLHPMGASAEELAAVKELLGIPTDYAVAAVLPLGKPVKQFSTLTRKPVSEFVTRGRFDGPAL